MFVAALYVEQGGPYFKMADVEPWDMTRDAREYRGPYPVVAHPPCGPWGKLRHLYNGDKGDRELAPLAVEQVRYHGGVLEHPVGSKLWDELSLPCAGECDAYGFTLEVDQCDWGHVARKRTLLYMVGVPRDAVVLPPKGTPTHWVSGTRSLDREPYDTVPPWMKVCSGPQRRRTPAAFARWLVDLAKLAIRPTYYDE